MNDIAEWVMLGLVPCAAFIDQSYAVGGDPVGHKCSNPATVTRWVGGGVAYSLCASCSDLLDARPERVTLPPWRATLGGG